MWDSNPQKIQAFHDVTLCHYFPTTQRHIPEDFNPNYVSCNSCNVQYSLFVPDICFRWGLAETLPQSAAECSESEQSDCSEYGEEHC